MAYYETLGQCLANDYTFKKIFSDNITGANKNYPTSRVLDGSTYGFQKGDFILVFQYLQNLSLKDAISTSGDIIVAGADMIFSVFDSSGLDFNTNDHTSAYGGIYLGKVTGNTITLTGGGIPAASDPHANGIIKSTYHVYRLCPRN